jgi:hypothetical protein
MREPANVEVEGSGIEPAPKQQTPRPSKGSCRTPAAAPSNRLPTGMGHGENRHLACTAGHPARCHRIIGQSGGTRRDAGRYRQDACSPHSSSSHHRRRSANLAPHRNASRLFPPPGHSTNKNRIFHWKKLNKPQCKTERSGLPERPNVLGLQKVWANKRSGPTKGLGQQKVWANKRSGPTKGLGQQKVGPTKGRANKRSGPPKGQTFI